MGFVVRDENVTSWFEINTNDGRIRVVRQMDREKAETIRLAIRAEDVAAATTDQTASGLKPTRLDSTRRDGIFSYLVNHQLFIARCRDVNNHSRRY